MGVTVGIASVWIATARDPVRPSVESPGPRSPATPIVPESGYSLAESLAAEFARASTATPADVRLARPPAPVPAPAPSPEQDPEWQAMRRERFGLAQYIVTSGHAVKLRKLLRHTALNPRDVYVPPARRQELEQMIAPVQAEIRQILKRRHEIAATEMSELIDKGGAVRLQHASGNHLDSSTLPPEARDYNVFRHVGDSTYMANLSTMPGSALAESVMHAKGTELAGIIAAWCHAEGLLTEKEYGMVLAGLSLPVTWNGK